MHDQELRELRRELATIERGRGRYYPPALRARITRGARRRLAGGDSVNAVARDGALHPTTLAAWLGEMYLGSFVDRVDPASGLAGPLTAAAAVTLAVTALAALRHVRQALALQPIEALR